MILWDDLTDHPEVDPYHGVARQMGYGELGMEYKWGHMSAGKWVLGEWVHPLTDNDLQPPWSEGILIERASEDINYLSQCCTVAHPNLIVAYRTGFSTVYLAIAKMMELGDSMATEPPLWYIPAISVNIERISRYAMILNEVV